MTKLYRMHLIVAGLYTLLAIIFTWPLAAQLTSHIPGEATWAFDESTFIWNMWWFKHSLLVLGQQPLYAGYIFYPLGVNLTTYTFNLFNAAFGLPLQLALSLPLANNLTLLFSYVSSAYGMFLLALYLLNCPPSIPPKGREDPLASPLLGRTEGGLTARLAAFLAGVVFAFSASRMMYVALGHYNFVTIQWFPFYILFLLKMLRGDRPGRLKRGFSNPLRAILTPARLRAILTSARLRAILTPARLKAILTSAWFRAILTPARIKAILTPAWLRAILTPARIKHSLLAALFAALCLYAELTYSVFLIFLTLIILSGSLLPHWRASKISVLKPLSAVALTGLLTLIFTAPFVLSVLPDFLDPAYAEPGWGEGLKLSADLAGLLTLTPLHPLAGVEWVTELRAVIEGSSRFSDANTLFLGYAILALALLGFIVSRQAGRVWLWSAIIFTILSLGPLLTINGQNRFDLDGLEVTFPLPFALLHYIPIINANRVPNRFGIPLTLSLAILTAYGLAWLLSKVSGVRGQGSEIRGQGLRVRDRGSGVRDQGLGITHHASRATQYAIRNTPILLLPVSLVLLIALMFDQYSVPLSLTEAGIPEVYYQIGAETDEFALMQLPLGWRNSYGTLGAERTQLQYYQAAHRRPMLGGNTSRNPAFKFDYYANIPLFKALTEAELYRSVDQATLDQARTQAAELMSLYNIKYLVIHEPVAARLPYQDTYLTTRNLALDLIPHQPEPIYQSPGAQAFAVEQAPLPDPLTIDFGQWRSDPYRGAGWAGNEEIFAATANWATAPVAQIFFPRRGNGDRRLAIDIAPFSYPGMPTQQVTLSLNGQPLPGNFSLHEGWQRIETILPETKLNQGLNRLNLRFARTAQPRQVLPARTTIGDTGLETPLDLEVNSSDDFAFITAGFGQAAVDASAHRQGINLAVIAPQSGAVAHVKGFDTAANEFEAAALAEFIAAIPEGYIVIAASQGPEATAFLDAEALAALKSLGLTTDNLTPPFSAIGVKGATSGAALQTMAGDGGAAYLRLGAPPDTRALAAAVDKIIISQP